MERIPDKRASGDLELPIVPESSDVQEQTPAPEVIRGPLERLRKEHREDRKQEERIRDIERRKHIH